MPPKSSRKPTMAKAKKMVTKQRKAKAKKNMDTFFLKTKVSAVITPSQGFAVANYIYNSFTLDPNSAAYITNAEFNLYKLQYDKFRVNSVKVTFIPKANVLDAVNNNNDGAFNVTGDGKCHTCVDRDGIAPASTAIISRYPSYRSYSVLKPWSRSYSVRYPTGIWLDAQAPATFTMSKELGLTGGVTVYAENLLEDNYEAYNEPWGTVLVEHNIVFQGKTSNSLTGVYDGSGNLTGVTINALSATPIRAQTTLVNVRGTLDQDTRTDNEVVETQINDQGL